MQKYGARRDLAEDLAATAEGIEVIHNKVIEKRQMDKKRERRKMRKKRKNTISTRTITRWQEIFLYENSDRIQWQQAKENLEAIGFDTDILLYNSKLTQAML